MKNKLNLNVSVAGRYRATLIDSITGKVRVAGEWFDNIITDAGLERMGVGAFLSRCHIGSGTATPTASDTGLQTPLAESSTLAVNDTTGAASTAPYYGWRRTTFRFAAGVGTGTVSEVGIFWATGNATAFSRALLPASITKLSTDVLDIAYELRNYAPASDIAFNCVVGGVTHACTARAANASSANHWRPFGIMPVQSLSDISEQGKAWSGAIGAVTSIPSGSLGSGSAASLAYVANSKQRRIQIDWNLDTANFVGGVRSISCHTTIGFFQCEFSPPINKAGPPIRSLHLTVFVSWARRA